MRKAFCRVFFRGNRLPRPPFVLLMRQKNLRRRDVLRVLLFFFLLLYPPARSGGGFKWSIAIGHPESFPSSGWLGKCGWRVLSNLLSPFFPPSFFKDAVPAPTKRGVMPIIHLCSILRLASQICVDRGSPHCVSFSFFFFPFLNSCSPRANSAHNKDYSSPELGKWSFTSFIVPQFVRAKNRMRSIRRTNPPSLLLLSFLSSSFSAARVTKRGRGGKHICTGELFFTFPLHCLDGQKGGAGELLLSSPPFSSLFFFLGKGRPHRGVLTSEYGIPV